MTRRLLLTAALAALAAGCASTAPAPVCIEPDVHVATNPWTHLDVNNDAETFQFAILGDRTGGARPGVFRQAVRKANLLQPEFVLCVGDLIEGYTEDPDTLAAQWNELDGIVSELEMPFFYVTGNHDIANPVMAEVYQRRRGRPYYHFTYKNVLFLILCTEDGGNGDTLSDAQVDSARAALDAHPDARWTLVFLHRPMWEYDSPAGFAAIEALLAERPYTVFAGHFHTYSKSIRHGRRYIRLATCGGASAMDGPDYGHVDHITWVTMTADGPHIANLLIDGIHDENMMTETTARFVDHLTREGGVQAGAIVADGAAFTDGTATITITNGVNVPMHLTGTVAAAPGVTATPDAIDLAVPEGGAASVEVHLTAAKPMTAEGAGATLTWRAEADLPDRPGFAVTRPLPIWIELAKACPTTASPITVDGSLDDWADLPYAIGAEGVAHGQSWSGPADASMRFAVTRDAETLYVAVRAIDDERVLRQGRPYYNQDAIEVWLDGRPRSERLATHAPAGGRLAFGVCPGSTAEHTDRARAVSTITDDGYAAEFAIPLAYLIDRQGPAWDGFRLNVVQFDADTEGTSQLRWRPSWRSADTYVSSGAFGRK